MSQFNEIYRLSGINIFNDITDTTGYQEGEEEPTNKSYKATVSISVDTRAHIDFSMFIDTGKIYNSIFTNGKEAQSIYKARLSIDPTNRLFATGTIGVERTRLYESSVNILAKEETVYNALVKVKASNDLYLRIGVRGSGDRLYRARFISWDDRDRLFNAFVNITVPDVRPEILYNATVNIQPPLYQNTYRSLVTISPSNKFKINYNMFSGHTRHYKANITTSKEKQSIFRARFIINPTNRLMAIGNISGYYEAAYNAMVNITAERYHSYAATVKVSLGSSMYMKMNILETPRHLFYGDLNKDAHVIETAPNSNYGGLDYLYMNNKSMVFMEWDFGENLDEYYLDHLEYGSGLKLNIRKALSNGSTGRIYLVKNNWEEYGITHSNKPTDLEFIREFNIPSNFVGELDISLGSLLIDYAKRYSFKISLAVEIDSEIDTFSNSRETNIMIPALYYVYWYIPPNIKQNMYRAKVKIRMAYGKGNGIDTDFPALGEERPWSLPARAYRAIIKDKITDPLLFYNAKIKIKTTDVENHYMAYMFNYNPISKTHIYRAKMKVPKFETESLYNSTLNIPDMKHKAYNAKFTLAKKTRDKDYLANIRTIKAYGKGNGRNTQYPALGEQRPWSKPARIYRAKFRIPRSNNEYVYNAIFTNMNIVPRHYRSTVKVPKTDRDHLYKATVFIQVPEIGVYNAIMKIPALDTAHLYRANHRVIASRISLYNAKIYIIPDRTNVHIFIM